MKVERSEKLWWRTFVVPIHSHSPNRSKSMSTPQSSPYFYSEVTSLPAATPTSTTGGTGYSDAAMAQLLLLMRQMTLEQHRTNELISELVKVTVGPYRARMKELSTWKSEHPDLARDLRDSVDVLLRTQMGWLETIAMEVLDGGETLQESEFMLNDFLDRFGPRMVYMNGMLQLFSQLASSPPAPEPKVQIVTPVPQEDFDSASPSDAPRPKSSSSVEESVHSEDDSTKKSVPPSVGGDGPFPPFA